MLRKRLISMVSALALLLSLFTLLPEGALRVEAFSYLDDNMISWYFSVDGAIAGGGANEEGATILSGTLKGGGDYTMVTVPSSVVDDEYHMTHPVIGLKASFDQAVFPSSIEYVFLPDTLLSIGYRAFSKCDKLQSITLPDGLTEIGDHAFFDCRSLKTITIPAGVKEINPSAFESCDQLAEVKFAEGTKLNTIYQKAFAYCSYLSSIVIPSTVTEIGPYAFNSCRSLTSINIPSSVTKIGALAFEGCTHLKTVYIPASVTEIGASAFDYIGYGATIYGYSGSYAETYANENSLNFRAIDTQVNGIGFSEIKMENGTMAYIARNGKQRTGITEITASTTPGLNDIKKGTTVTMTADVPDGYEFEGYEVTYDFTATVNGTAYHVYYKTLTQTTAENTFLADIPEEAVNKLIPFIIMKMNSSNPQNITFSGKINAKAVYEKVAHDLGTITFDLSKSLKITNDDPTLYTYIDTILKDNHPSNILEALFENGADPYKYTFMVNIDKVDTFDVYISVKDGKLLVTRPEAESASGEYTLSMKDSSIAAYKEEGKDYYSKLKVIFPSADTYEPADFGTMTLDFTLDSSHVIRLYEDEKVNRVKATLYALGKSGRINISNGASYDLNKDGMNDFEISNLRAIMYGHQTVGGFSGDYVLTEQEIGYIKDYYRENLALTTPAELKAAGAGYHGKICAVFPEITKYDLYVCGTQVTVANARDILGNGVFKYNAGMQTLTINGDYNSDSTLIQNTGIDGLVINVTGTSNLTSELSFLSAKANTTLTGQGKLTVDCKYAGIAIDKDVTVTIKKADVSITATGVGGNLVISDNMRAGNRNNAIIFDNSNVYLESKTSAACAIIQNIEFNGCTIAEPVNGYIEKSNKNNYKSIVVKKDGNTSSFATVIKIEANKRQAGDINGDGSITADDAIIAARLAAGYGDYTTRYDSDVADMNGDGKVTADDAIIIARYAAGYGNYREIYTKYI